MGQMSKWICFKIWIKTKFYKCILNKTKMNNLNKIQKMEDIMNFKTLELSRLLGVSKDKSKSNICISKGLIVSFIAPLQKLHWMTTISNKNPDNSNISTQIHSSIYKTKNLVWLSKCRGVDSKVKPNFQALGQQQRQLVDKDMDCLQMASILEISKQVTVRNRRWCKVNRIVDNRWLHLREDN